MAHKRFTKMVQWLLLLLFVGCLIRYWVNKQTSMSSLSFLLKRTHKGVSKLPYYAKLMRSFITLTKNICLNKNHIMVLSRRLLSWKNILSALINVRVNFCCVKILPALISCYKVFMCLFRCKYGFQFIFLQDKKYKKIWENTIYHFRHYCAW